MSVPAAATPDLQHVRDHNGDPRSEEFEMFAPPPPPIGELVSAGSTLLRTKREWAMGPRIAAILAPLAFGIVVAILNVQGPHPRSNVTVAWVAVIVGGIVSLIVWAKTGFSHSCTYVGRAGLASITLQGSRSGPQNRRMMLFRDAVALNTSVTHHSTNGVYQHTAFDYHWTGQNGTRLFALTGSYNRNKPVSTNQIHFARSAEVAWSLHVLDSALLQLEREGSIAFPVGGVRVVRVGEGFLEFHGFSDEPWRVTKQEIAKVTLGGGQFMFKHVDAKWYSREGKFGFSYANMGNARVFMLVLDKLMGYRWD